MICGSKNSYIATVVERQSRFTILVKVEGKITEAVVSALVRQMSELPRLLRQSLTWDRETELAAHKKFSLATNMDVYFCDPSSRWQRGTNENTNGLLRQCFPKKSCLSIYSQNELNSIAEQLNSRPRKTLGFKTPADKLETVLPCPLESITPKYGGITGQDFPRQVVCIPRHIHLVGNRAGHGYHLAKGVIGIMTDHDLASRAFSSIANVIGE